jgi:hypothetical protein
VSRWLQGLKFSLPALSGAVYVEKKSRVHEQPLRLLVQPFNYEASLEELYTSHLHPKGSHDGRAERLL